MPEKYFTSEAVGEFPFSFWIEKAEAIEENSEMELEGIASTTNVDHDKERMSKDALKAMETTINKDGVPLRVEHQKEGSAVIGRVYKAWVDERNQLHVRARLDKNHPVSPILHSSMKQGTKMGLSVGGLVKRAIREFSEATGGMIKTFYDVALQEVSVTPRPANYDSWLIAKSIAKDEKEAEEFRDNEALRREFFFENPQFNYLQSFAKSVPDKAWKRVDSKINKETNKNMSDETKEEMKETEKAVSRSEFNSLTKGFKDLVSAVSKGFENVTNMVKAMDSDAKDVVNPDKKKPEDESPVAKEMDGDAKDQTNPDKKKPDDDSATAKATKDDDMEDETKKAEADGTDEDGEREKATKDDKDDTYDLQTLNRSIKTIDSLTKRIKLKKAEETDEKETEKAEDTDEKETEKAEETDEKETTKNVHPLDAFVVSVTKMMEAMTEKMEKSGKRVLGFEKSFVEDLQNSPEVQAEIMKLMKVPGFKKSVSMGVPYMPTKEGKRFPLVAVNPQNEVKKSQVDKNVKFTDLYKQEYSSLAEAENE